MRQLATSVAGVAALCTVLAATAVAGPWRISDDPGTIVLEYGHVDHLLAEQDPLPLIRIYGDGQVWVHYPVDTLRAGDYELRLGRNALHDLMRAIQQDGLLEFDRRRALQRRAALRDDRDSLHPVTGKTDTMVRIRLERYKGRTEFDKSIVWTNVETDARAYPGLTSVQALARLEHRLQAVIDNRKLSPVQLPLAQR